MRKKRQTRNRRPEIINGAKGLFLTKGYHKTTFAEIVAVCGGSLDTIYKEFGNKEGLFKAVIRSVSDADHWSRIENASLDDKSPFEALTLLADIYLDFQLSSEAVALHRVISAEVLEFPEIGRLCLSEIHGKFHDKLARYLEKQAALGAVDVSDYQKTAEAFFGIMRGEVFLYSLLDPVKSAKRSEMVEYQQLALRIFARGIGLTY